LHPNKNYARTKTGHGPSRPRHSPPLLMTTERRSRPRHAQPHLRLQRCGQGDGEAEEGAAASGRQCLGSPPPSWAWGGRGPAASSSSSPVGLHTEKPMASASPWPPVHGAAGAPGGRLAVARGLRGGTAGGGRRERGVTGVVAVVAWSERVRGDGATVT
jgi:hypothetical protein